VYQHNNNTVVCENNVEEGLDRGKKTTPLTLLYFKITLKNTKNLALYRYDQQTQVLTYYEE
jgi:hypothetical protein